MEKRQENKLSSYQATEEHLDQTLKIYASNVIFSKGVGDFKTEVGVLKKQAVIQIEDITGYAEKKEDLKEELVKLIMQVASGLYAISFVNNDDHIRESVNVSESTLKYMRDNDLLAKGTGIYEKGEKHSDALVECGIPKEIVNKMGVSLKDFETIIATPRDKIDTRSTSTEAIKMQFEKIDDILKNILDKLINIYRYSHPDFYFKYKKSRIIVDLGVRHRKEVEE